MNVTVDIQTASAEPVPDEEDIRGWVRAALHGRMTSEEAEVSVRLVDEAEMTALNQTYRDKTGSTNVLSFPTDLPAGVDTPLLGDIVICAPVVRREAAEQGKTEESHWAHMTVHGSLHLLGYDHVRDEDAATMEALETQILQQLNYDCPYTQAGQREHTT